MFGSWNKSLNGGFGREGVAMIRLDLLPHCSNGKFRGYGFRVQGFGSRREGLGLRRGLNPLSKGDKGT